MNLLFDPLLRVKTTQGVQSLSLPALLAALAGDRVESLLGLQRHQEDAFHIFLCYLAGAALARNAKADPRQPEAFWREALHRLAGQKADSAWSLVVKDPTRPAFLQAPVESEEEFDRDYRTERPTPDAIDVLLTAKNHDVKATKAMAAPPEAWVYALVSVQTMAGYVLKHQGIARMNSGLGSRVCVSLLYGETPGQRWLRDTRKLLSARPGLLQPPWPYRADGLVLTWLEPWNRRTSLELDRLDPFFIEIARGIRLTWQDRRIVARTASEHLPRLNAKTWHGVLGDPWIPINRHDPKKGQSALTVGPVGFTPELLRNLMFEDGFALTPMQQPDSGQDERPCQFAAAVLVRGQGITDGFHSVAVPMPRGTARRVLQAGPERDRLARLSKIALAAAIELQNRALKPALLCLLQAGADRIDFDKREISAWWQHSARRYAHTWGACFFPWLWEAGESASDLAALRRWRMRLQEAAALTIADALAGYPGRRGRRYRARVRAETIFCRNLRKVFSGFQGDSDEPGLAGADALGWDGARGPRDELGSLAGSG